MTDEDVTVSILVPPFVDEFIHANYGSNLVIDRINFVQRVFLLGCAAEADLKGDIETRKKIEELLATYDSS
jgi:hypothetical protein